MTEFETVLLMILMYVNGVMFGYIAWAPDTPFKKGLVDGLSLKFLWGKK
jgi:hypothetical protein